LPDIAGSGFQCVLRRGHSGNRWAWRERFKPVQVITGQPGRGPRERGGGRDVPRGGEAGRGGGTDLFGLGRVQVRDEAGPLVPGAGLPQVSQLLATSPRRPAWPTSRSGRYTRWWPMTATARPACRLRRRRTGRARVSGRPGPPVPQRAAGVVWPARQRACVAEPRGRRMSRPREIYQGCS
jgi:hypothetical protein